MEEKGLDKNIDKSQEIKESAEIRRRKKEKTTKVLIAIISVLIVAVGIMGWFINDLSRQTTELMIKEHEVTVEKENLKQELEFLLESYERLETENDSLNQKIIEEKEHIMNLIKELEAVKIYNYRVQREYEQELSSLRQIMRHYVYQIDSLDQLNKQLIAENIQIRGDRERIREELDEVVHRYDELELVVEGASVVRAARIEFELLNSRGRERSRARWIDRLKTTFTLQANDLAKSGPRRIYLAVINPAGKTLSQGLEFEYQESVTPYSVHRDVIYENLDLTVSIFYDFPQTPDVGTYRVLIYMDNAIIGSSSFLIEN